MSLLRPNRSNIPRNSVSAGTNTDPDLNQFASYGLHRAPGTIAITHPKNAMNSTGSGVAVQRGSEARMLGRRLRPDAEAGDQMSGVAQAKQHVHVADADRIRPVDGRRRARHDPPRLARILQHIGDPAERINQGLG